MAVAAAQVRKGRKYDQVLEGARQVFMSDGFDGASVDDIARAANVSKATLYSYFADKRLLFMEVATSECCRQSEHATDDIDMTAPPQQVLEQAGRHFLKFITSTFGLQIFRICVAESDRFPDLGREFYNSGPAVMRATVTAYLQQAVARGELVIDDLDMAADQFAELCKADIWPRLIFGVIDRATDDQIDRVVGNAVRTFMARYGA